MQCFPFPVFRSAARLTSILRRLCLPALLVLLAGVLRGKDAATSNFDLPSDYAARTFKLFSGQSGRGLIADADLVRGVRTQPVKGAYTPGDALARMLAGTGLWATEDPKNGAFVVHRENPDPNDQRAAPPTGSGRPRGRTQASLPASLVHL